MDTSFVKFPVTCPRCGAESLARYRPVAVTIALTEWHSMRLYAPCHDVFWDASTNELNQISAYLAVSWLGVAPSDAVETTNATAPSAAFECDQLQGASAGPT